MTVGSGRRIGWRRRPPTHDDPAPVASVKPNRSVQVTNGDSQDILARLCYYSPILWQAGCTEPDRVAILSRYARMHVQGHSRYKLRDLEAHSGMAVFSLAAGSGTPNGIEQTSSGRYHSSFR
jgi:hypothetical protein